MMNRLGLVGKIVEDNCDQSWSEWEHHILSKIKKTGNPRQGYLPDYFFI